MHLALLGYPLTHSFSKTYFDFIYEQFAHPILDRIQLNTAVSSIDYQSEQVVITYSNGSTYTADKVIVTVPISILKLNEINFIPAIHWTLEEFDIDADYRLRLAKLIELQRRQ